MRRFLDLPPSDRRGVSRHTTVVEGCAGKESSIGQHGLIEEPHVSSHAVTEQLAAYPLLEALIERRSRGFGRGMRLNGGPLF